MNIKATVYFGKVKSGYFAGDVIAFFTGSRNPAEVLCYEHFGQHGKASIEYLTDITEPAAPEEYETLRAELEDLIGYDLDIVSYSDFLDTIRREST